MRMAPPLSTSAPPLRFSFFELNDKTPPRWHATICAGRTHELSPSTEPAQILIAHFAEAFAQLAREAGRPNGTVVAEKSEQDRADDEPEQRTHDLVALTRGRAAERNLLVAAVHEGE